MNTGFSWVRIDKGTIQCTFRYLSQVQVETVINRLKSNYAYQNISCGLVDLGDPLLPDSDGDGYVADHYRPSGGDPYQSYYWMVELHRHGTIIPQGCIEIIKQSLNDLAFHTIIPESVYIKRLKSNIFTVGDTESLDLLIVTPNPYTGTVEWTSTDTDIVTITPDGTSCTFNAVAPGEADIIATITVPEVTAKEMKTIPTPSALWVGNIIKYTGPTVTYKFYNGKYYPSDYELGELVTFTQNNYYECNQNGTAYSWDASSYDGTPVDVYYRDIYSIGVRTYIAIETYINRLCLYHGFQFTAFSPSSPALTINWASVNSCAVFDGGVHTGDMVMVVGNRVGSTTISAEIEDSYGVYTDICPLTIYAIAVNPKSIKMVVGAEKNLTIAKNDIFMTEIPGDDPQPIPVDFVSASAVVATVEQLPTPLDPVVNHAEATVTAQGVGRTFVTVIAEDPTDGASYSDTCEIVVGNVAINKPADATIYLLSGTTTLTLTAELSAGFEIASDGWVSANPTSVEITTISGTDNNTCVVTGLTEGSSLITVTATSGSASDTDQILIKVLDAAYVTTGEMYTFTHGQFNGHGVVDWDPKHPSEMEIEEGIVDLATQPEVDEFIDDLFDANAEDADADDDADDDADTPEDDG